MSDPRQMQSDLSELDTRCNSEVRRCQTKLKLLERGTIAANEFFYDLLIGLVGTDARCWHPILHTLPYATLREFLSYCKKALEPSDFTFSPEPFVTDESNHEMLDATRLELRPKYISLYKAIREVVESSQEQ